MHVCLFSQQINKLKVERAVADLEIFCWGTKNVCIIY